MKHLILLVLPCTLLFCFDLRESCAQDAEDKTPTYEQFENAVKERISLLTELNGILDLVKDEETAEAQTPKITSLATKMKAAKKTAEALGKPTDENQSPIEAEL